MSSKEWTNGMHATIARHMVTPVKVAAAIGQCLWYCLRTLPSSSAKRPAHCTSEEATDELLPEGETHMRSSFRCKRLRVSDEESDALHKAFVWDRMAGYTPPETSEDTTTESAVKHDKAAVPEHLWNNRVAFLLTVTELQSKHLHAFQLTRERMLRQWKWNVRASWQQWWQLHELHVQARDLEWVNLIRQRGEIACRHAEAADFWTWPVGSGIFFWRWPQEFIRDVAIRVAPLWTKLPQQRIEKQSALGDAAMVAMITTKLEDVCGKGYVHAHLSIKATMNYFAVPKGNTDVRMVYNGTKSGLNECLYAPWFFLPDSDALA
ncbi:hypothetical protein ACA910_016450 [Epithemia clementina (nom. ined.)]